jgi:ribonuclease P protein component
MSGPPPSDGARRYRFPSRLRLTRARQFDAVFASGRRRAAGPLLVLARPNRLSHCRLGLSVSRRAGGAVVRNRIKRLLREAFRTLQHDLPGGYDLVISVRRHEPLSLAEYGRLLREAVTRLDRSWIEDGERSSREPGDPGGRPPSQPDPSSS